MSYLSHIEHNCPHLEVSKLPLLATLGSGIAATCAFREQLLKTLQVHAGPNLWCAIRIRTPDAAEVWKDSDPEVLKQASCDFVERFNWHRKEVLSRSEQLQNWSTVFGGMLALCHLHTTSNDSGDEDAPAS